MEERSQGAVEYLLMLAAALVIVSSIVVMLRNVSTGLGSNVNRDLENVRQSIVNILT